MTDEAEGDEDCEEQDELTGDFLSLDPPLVAVFDGESYDLVGFKHTSKLQCLLCDHHCKHVHHIKDWCSENNVHLDKEEPLQEKQSFDSVSSLPIPYPLQAHLQKLHDKHERGGTEFPVQLIPPHNVSLKCEHGHVFNPADPVQNGWISRKGTIIYKESTTIDDKSRTTLYRPPVVADKRYYDGQDDLLFNLDGKHLFYYGYLFRYLHLMLEGKNPLIAFFRASTRCFLVQSQTKPVSIKLLRQAWNASARLLRINFSDTFTCPLCGPSPNTII